MNISFLISADGQTDGTLQLRGMFGEEGGDWDWQAGLFLTLPIAVFMQLPWHLSVNLTGWVPLGELVTGANKHYQGWLQYKEKPWIFKNTFWSQILVWLKSNHRAENWRKTELKCGKLFSTRWSNAGSPKCSPTSLTPLWTPCPCPSSTKPWTKGIERENAQRKKCKEAEGQKFRED